MRITEAARRLGLSARMLRYREALGLLPDGGDRRRGGHRHYDEEDLDAVRLALALERRYQASPSELAFGLRALADPEVAARLRALGQRIGWSGLVAAPPSRAVDFEKQRALRWLTGSRAATSPDSPAEPG